jgi:hypothetical protein
MPRSRLDRLGRRVGERRGELVTRMDPELPEHLAQMPLDGGRAEKEPRTAFRVRQPIPGQLGNLPLLRGQIVACLRRPPTHPLARRQQLLTRTLGERVHPDRRELVVRAAELGARVDPATLAAQPLAVEQACARESDADPSPLETLNRLD